MEKETISTLANPIMIYEVECPICFTQKIKFYALKAKTVSMRPNVFEIPIYEPSPKYTHIDFNELTHSVCPHCFFVASKKSDFINFDPSTDSRIDSQCDKKILNHFQNFPKEVMTILQDCFVNHESFQYPRTSEGVLTSYKLAVYKATLEIFYKIPYSYLKRARFYLRMYYFHNKFYKKLNSDYLMRAAEDLEEVFKLSDFPDRNYEFEVCYLLVAVNIRLGDDGKAGNFIKILDQSKGELTQKAKDNPNVNLTDINKWLGKTKELWQSRTEEDVWKLEKPLNF
jgi:hypothetical protein